MSYHSRLNGLDQVGTNSKVELKVRNLSRIRQNIREWISSKPLPNTPETYLELNQRCRECISDDQFLNVEKAPDLDPRIKSYFLKLNHWKRFYNKEADIQKEIQSLISQKSERASNLKKQRLGEFMSRHSIYDDFSQFKKGNAYSETFPYNHSLWIEEEDPLDICWMNIPVTENELALQDFRKHLSHLLDGIKLPIFDLDQIKYDLKTTMCNSELGKSIPFFADRLSKSKVEFSTKLRGKRCVIPVSQANMRDSVKLDVESFYTVAAIRKILLPILDQLDEAALKTNLYEAESTYEEIVKPIQIRNKYYYVRDLKKCGLTFNRRLFSIVREELIKLDPIYELLRVYDNIEIELDKDIEGLGKEGQTFVPKRGYILGMAAELVTLCQVVIDRMNRTKIDSDDVQTLFYHDDHITMSRDKSVIQNYEIADAETCSDLGLIIKTESTTILRNGSVFLEKYRSFDLHYDQSKKILIDLAIYSYIEGNITFAKECINSFSDLFYEGPEIEFALGTLVKHYGYEFTEEEVNLPFIFGGWQTPTKDGVDMSLIDLPPNPRLLDKLFKACSIPQIRLAGKNIRRLAQIKPEQGPYPELLTDSIHLEVDSEKVPFIVWNKEEINKILSSQKSRSNNPEDYYNRQLEQRQIEFKKKSNVIFIKEVIEKVLEHYDKLFYIPEEYLIFEDEVTPCEWVDYNPFPCRENLSDLSERDILLSEIARLNPLSVAGKYEINPLTKVYLMSKGCPKRRLNYSLKVSKNCSETNFRKFRTNYWPLESLYLQEVGKRPVDFKNLEVKGKGEFNIKFSLVVKEIPFVNKTIMDLLEQNPEYEEQIFDILKGYKPLSRYKREVELYQPEKIQAEEVLEEEPIYEISTEEFQKRLKEIREASDTFKKQTGYNDSYMSSLGQHLMRDFASYRNEEPTMTVDDEGDILDGIDGLDIFG